MRDRFLLYIDILGFSDLVSRGADIDALYKIIDSLNVHQHDVFKTIVFSDTILVYNDKPVGGNEMAQYVTWYATEFAEDLHFRLIKKNIYFRAFLTYGEFFHKKLNNVESFYGKALFKAYNTEKNIQTTGLIIDETILEYLRFFDTVRYDNGLHYVYLERTFKNIISLQFGSDKLPIEPSLFDGGEALPYLKESVAFLKGVFNNMREHPSPRVRQKYLSTWDLYHQKYPAIIDYLLKNDFSYQSISPSSY